MATGSNSGTKRFTLSASVPGEIASPISVIHAATRWRGRQQTKRSNRMRTHTLIP